MSNAPASDEQAIVHLMTTYGTDIRRLCLCLLNDSFLAEDAAQETFFKAWKHYAGFRKECSEKTWLSRIAVNTCRSMQRGSWFRSVFAQAAEKTERQEAALPPDYDPTVWNAVQALPEQLKSALVLRYWEGLPLQEAAITLGTNVNTLNTRIRKAKAVLQENLKGWYFDEED
ncbi:MAG: RNA polymerase sigma factor [Clostridia bacterium]|nr:RNA polymerase sigma factor [Clostridia bacterium]